jgi:hypothetical protein
MTYRFQRNIPMYLPVIVLTFISWAIFTLGFCCGKICENAKNEKEKERQIFLQKEVHKIA